MILDLQHQLSNSQALTATAVSTNVYDSSSDRNVGIGEPMAVLINVEVAADFTTTDETYQFDIQTDDNVGFSSATVIASRAILAAALTLGSFHVLVLPKDTSAERFLRMNYTLAGTTPTVTISAHLMPLKDIQADVIYPGGSTIS